MSGVHPAEHVRPVSDEQAHLPDAQHRQLPVQLPFLQAVSERRQGSTVRQGHHASQLPLVGQFIRQLGVTEVSFHAAACAVHDVVELLWLGRVLAARIRQPRSDWVPGTRPEATLQRPRSARLQPAIQRRQQQHERSRHRVVGPAVLWPLCEHGWIIQQHVERADELDTARYDWQLQSQLLPATAPANHQTDRSIDRREDPWTTFGVAECQRRERSTETVEFWPAASAWIESTALQQQRHISWSH